MEFSVSRCRMFHLHSAPSTTSYIVYVNFSMSARRTSILSLVDVMMMYEASRYGTGCQFSDRGVYVMGCVIP
jgi:hypothetical protein